MPNALSRRPDHKKGVEHDNDDITLIKPEQIRRLDEVFGREHANLQPGLKKQISRFCFGWRRNFALRLERRGAADLEAGDVTRPRDKWKGIPRDPKTSAEEISDLLHTLFQRRARRTYAVGHEGSTVCG